MKVRRTDIKEDLLKDAVLFPDGESGIGSTDEIDLDLLD